MNVIEFVTMFWDLFQFAVIVATAVVLMWAVVELLERRE